MVLIVALVLTDAARSPLLQWRDPVYIVGGFAGIVGLVFLLAQPLLIGGALPGMTGRRAHVWLGSALVLAVIVHVGGLWITSPPDVVDVLLLRSPTPFGIWGLAAMWAVFAAALLGAIRKKTALPLWRMAHTATTSIVVFATVIHAWQIEGAMSVWPKTTISIIVVCTFVWSVTKRRVWRAVRARTGK